VKSKGAPSRTPILHLDDLKMKLKFKLRRPDLMEVIAREILQHSDSTKPNIEVVCSRRRERMLQFSKRMKLPRWSSKNSDSEAKTVADPPAQPQSIMSNHDIETGAQMPLQDVENGDVGPSTLMGLPAELRHEIWSLCWEPRTVEVHPYTNDEIQDKAELFSSDTYRSTSKPPVTLFICRQSRLDTLRYYKLSFAAYKQEPQVYFNLQIDELYVKHPELARFEQFFLMFPHEDLSKLQHLRVSENIMQRIFNASACYNREQQPGWIRSEPMTGILRLKTLVVQRELKSSSWVQTGDACFWFTKSLGGGSRRRNPPWEKVFEYLGEGAWPMILVEGHQGVLQYSEIKWHNFGGLIEYCCRPDPIGTLISLRNLRKPLFLCLDELPCRCLLFSTRRWITVGTIGDPKTGKSRFLDYHNLCDKLIWYTIPRLKLGQSKPPNRYKAGSGERMKWLKRQYIEDFGDIDGETAREWLKRQYRMKWKYRRELREVIVDSMLAILYDESDSISF
jgi:hypothetical protein